MVAVGRWFTRAVARGEAWLPLLALVSAACLVVIAATAL
jgi:hypothetical protein